MNTNEPIPADEATSTPAKEPAKIEFTDVTYDGLDKVVASHKGSVVVIDVWATFCAPCMKKFPHFQDEWLRGGPVRRWVPKGYAGKPVYTCLASFAANNTAASNARWPLTIS